MPKINQEEYEVLKRLDDKWKWIARDRDTGKLPYSDMVHVYEEKPFKIDNVWTVGYGAGKLEKNLFQFIQWEDKEPHNIAELIEEYESSQMTYFDRKLISEYECFTKESEETEVKKDKKWAQKEVDRYLSYEGVNEARNALAFAKGVIDQLDEQEVLSQEWIGENKSSWTKLKVDGYYIPVEKLQNLLVPEQERLTMPNYVAKWISEHHERFDLYPALRRLEEGSTRDYDAYKWYRANTLKFVAAYLTGVYEVEEEQRYVVELPNPNNQMGRHKNVFLNKKDGKVFIDSADLFVNDITKYGQFALTEEEIKKDFEWAWEFAKPVEELEE